MTPENTQAFERSMDMLDSYIREMRREHTNDAGVVGEIWFGNSFK